MKTWMVVAAVALALMLTGCVTTWNPLYTEKDLTDDPALLGVWSDEKGEETWEFRAAGPAAYTFIYTEKGLPAEFEAYLVRVGNFRFLDLLPKDPGTMNEFFKMHLIPVHTFFRVDGLPETLRLTAINYTWLKQKLETKKIRTGYEISHDRLVLTAPTARLRELVRKYAADPQAFSDPVELRRVEARP